MNRISYFLGVNSRRAEEQEAWSNVEELVQQIHGISPDMGLWFLAGCSVRRAVVSEWSSVWEKKYKNGRSTHGLMMERFHPRVRGKIMDIVAQVSEGAEL